MRSPSKPHEHVAPPPRCRSVALILGLLLLPMACRARAVPSSATARPNVLLVCIDDLRPELASFGASHVRSPNIDALAREGRAFTRHYVQAPTCGASRAALLFGRYARAGEGRGNDALARRARDPSAASRSLPATFRAAGYATVAVGKVSHHPGGRLGPEWDDVSQPELPGAWTRHSMPTGAWGSPRGAMHGLAQGRRRQRGVTPALESFPGSAASYPDGLIAQAAVEELEQLARGQAPFFLAVGFLDPHLPFGMPREHLEAYADVVWPSIEHPERPEGRTTWHGSGEFFGGYGHDGRDPREDPDYAHELRRHYTACVTYVDSLVGVLLARLAELDLEQDTIVVLWGDHGWHLGEHGVWGKHTLFEESLRAPLVLRVPGMASAGEASDAVVESVDLFPTLCELAGIDAPLGLDGRSLGELLDRPGASGHAAISYKPGATTLRNARHRLIVHADGFVELYDHERDPGELENTAASSTELVRELRDELERRLAP